MHHRPSVELLQCIFTVSHHFEWNRYTSYFGSVSLTIDGTKPAQRTWQPQIDQPVHSESDISYDEPWDYFMISIAVMTYRSGIHERKPCRDQARMSYLMIGWLKRSSHKIIAQGSNQNSNLVCNRGDDELVRAPTCRGVRAPTDHGGAPCLAFKINVTIDCLTYWQ